MEIKKQQEKVIRSLDLKEHITLLWCAVCPPQKGYFS